MTRRLNNFRVVADIDGQCTQLKGGPRSKDGGMRVKVYQLKEGKQVLAVDLICRVLSDGTLVTSMFPVQHLITEGDEEGRVWIETSPTEPEARQVELPGEVVDAV
jgi:hypothetical protein